MPRPFVSFRPLGMPLAMAALPMVLAGCASWTPAERGMAMAVGVAVVAGAISASQSHHDQAGGGVTTAGLHTSPGRAISPQMLACANNVACMVTAAR